MSKGISYIVASIIMLIITISLAGTAYLYISGYFTSAIQGIEVTDAFCSLGEVTLKIKNIGTDTITTLDIEQTSPSYDILEKEFQGTIEPGKTVQYKDICEGEKSRKCIYRITPSIGKTITADIPCSDKPDSLVLALSFDEGSGTTTKDRSGYGNDGILNDSTPVNYDGFRPPQWIDSKFGKALHFDGVDDFVSVADHEVLNITDAITIEVWIKLDLVQTDEYDDIINKDTESYYMWIENEGNDAYVGFDGESDWADIIAPHTIDVGEWYHIAASYDKDGGINNVKLYVNGRLVGNDTMTGPIEEYAGPVHIGAYGPLLWAEKYHFNGTIDEVRIYNKAII